MQRMPALAAEGRSFCKAALYRSLLEPVINRGAAMQARTKLTMGSSKDLAAPFSAATEPAVRCAAPGRVNLIGEHTDYSGGFVMPVAIVFRTVATIRTRNDGQIFLSSDNM